MALRRHNAKRDSNEGPIVEAFRAMGCLVQRMDQPVDLLIYVPMARAQRMHLVEVKVPGGKLNDNQRGFVALGWPVHIIRSVDEALNLVKSLREAA